MSLIHKPVLVEEVVRILQPMDKSTYIDCTIGGAGHALRILESSKPKGFLIGIDTDREALELAKENLKNYKGRFELINDRFERLTLILNDLKIKKVDGILFDLGMSSIQLDDPDRGFSFKKEGKLDMRFSKKQELDVYYLVNNYS